MTRTQAIQLARKAREKKSKEKVQNAINLLRLYGKKINGNSVSIEAGVSPRTARKYLKYLKLRKR